MVERLVNDLGLNNYKRLIVLKIWRTLLLKYSVNAANVATTNKRSGVMRNRTKSCINA
jgi:hypothetical protein